MREEVMNRLKKEVKAELGRECKVQFQKVEKNNGVKLQSIMIQEPEITVSPAIYIDKQLEKIEDGSASVSAIAQEIVGIYKNSNAEKFSGIIKGLNKDEILKKVTYQLINSERNLKMLENIPHRKWLDLSAIYRFIVSEDEEGTASIMVSHLFCSTFGISNDELDEAARRNTEAKGFCTMSMEELIAEMTGIPAERINGGTPGMFVLTNETQTNGAAVMLYEKYFDDLARKLEDDLYIMPCNIHEVIVVPVDGFDDATAIREWVSSANAAMVSENEILSGSVYRYSLEAGNIFIV